MSGSRRVRAPGKAMLFGEYAVLRGGPALVAAVDRYAVADLDPAAREPASPFVACAVQQAGAWLGARGGALPAGVPVIDSSALSAGGAGGRKLGLGSSSAVTVAAWGAVLDAAGALPAAFGAAEIASCRRAHHEAQGGSGSGADVAAALFGGVIRFVARSSEDADTPAITPMAVEEFASVTLVDTGTSASTAERLERLARAEEHDRRGVASVLTALGDIAELVARDVARTGSLVIDPVVIKHWNRALRALEDLIGLPILVDANARADEAARVCGGAAKPSGAGGGDLAVCFTPPDARARLLDELRRRGLEPLDVRIGARGLHAIEPHDPRKDAT